ncbi:hypothetical protein GCM10010464_77310 [Pseudonocardia yunnanensis]
MLHRGQAPLVAEVGDHDLDRHSAPPCRRRDALQPHPVTSHENEVMAVAGESSGEHGTKTAAGSGDECSRHVPDATDHLLKER